MKNFLIIIRLDNSNFKTISLEASNMKAVLNFISDQFTQAEIYQITLIS